MPEHSPQVRYTPYGQELDRNRYGQACYEAWARRADFFSPVVDEWTGRERPRRNWQHLTAVVQETWCCVADAVAALLVGQ